ncbi:glutaredoxin family protein [Ethanoligenens harbinense]|uniref:Glutaredoxin n=1 Tax=Ethanoligenens harbinense (strain DSM 18485 / JCM 12961 / CGMCC 1.5033 / YUAN-3) TaxID=663278 RepID=E6U6V5_ETHHY|nr:thioredoxin family protein [Ethanoligenens harbinense]ADU26922.1 glutaredoxin [Ethanoligenens harbinense YUAN-3]AVQ96017.1 thioredoxin [Ethanoligenens harbinense YUAN-3]AYF38678.1 thioredoxin [Ethanoligenens harbinense]AYF41425.1 thioredoxin [Ethanoligenens harbinense]QCN92259.1 thioredoxin [Ethanoligenens harbinense]
MKKITMFTMQGCPYCKRAFEWMENLKNKNPVYKALEIHVIDEQVQPEIANQYDYYYVPTFYVDGNKLHEGIPSPEKIEAVFEAAVKG